MRYLRGKSSTVFFNRNPNLPRILFFPHHYVTLSYPEAILAYTCENLAQCSFSFERIRWQYLIELNSLNKMKYPFIKQDKRNRGARDYILFLANKKL